MKIRLFACFVLSLPCCCVILVHFSNIAINIITSKKIIFFNFYLWLIFLFFKKKFVYLTFLYLFGSFVSWQNKTYLLTYLLKRDPRSWKDPRPRTLWRPRTTGGRRALWGLRTFWGTRTLGRPRTLRGHKTRIILPIKYSV